MRTARSLTLTASYSIRWRGDAWPGECVPGGGACHAHPPWTEWQTLVKILPCPKLKLDITTSQNRYITINTYYTICEPQLLNVSNFLSAPSLTWRFVNISRIVLDFFFFEWAKPKSPHYHNRVCFESCLRFRLRLSLSVNRWNDLWPNCHSAV